ncbi:MAG TPA: response regulator [Spirochaetia bacterium]|nr:response regulator [Spirochaetia bacterium]
MGAGSVESSGKEIRSVKTVLVIDDDELNLKLVNLMLTSEGFRVLCAASAEEGLELLRQEKPTVVLMDIRLSGMSGLEATRRLKADHALSAIPVVAVSAYAMEEDIARASEAGCSGYLVKPFRRKELVEAIEKAVTMKG